ncbi:MAG: hypothetical protein M5U34_05415 [Chloroflexi bacterium]|nr:hypothetical protein [Chloroflexota bacterium]
MVAQDFGGGVAEVVDAAANFEDLVAQCFKAGLARLADDAVDDRFPVLYQVIADFDDLLGALLDG